MAVTPTLWLWSQYMEPWQMA